MKIISALFIGLIGLLTLSHTASMAQSRGTQPSVGENESASPEASGISESNINEFCETNAVTPPQPGIQFDGNPASPEVLQLAPGNYAHPNSAGLLLYPGGRYFVQPPLREQEINGALTMVRGISATSGPDFLLPVDGVIGGCSAEQLSEVMLLNAMSVDALELVMGHNDSYIDGSHYSYREVSDFCVESGEQPQPGIQFDGAVASSAVMAMEPGEYGYLDEGRLMLFPDGAFLLKFPEEREDVGLTNGPDLFNSVGIIGCSAEQLSEVIAKNELSIDLFDLMFLYN